MKAFFAFLRTTLAGGILLLLPVVLLIIILGKAYDMTTVLVKDDETWNIGFPVEENNKFCTVFIPEAPRHDSGEVKIVPIEWVKKLDVGSNKMALSLKRFGKGALAHVDL